MLHAYCGSDAASKTEPGCVISVLDLDGTMAESRDPPARELDARREMRTLAESRGPLAFSTARTPELVMSRKALMASAPLGFTRPEARWSTDESGTRIAEPLEEVAFFRHLLDPDVINAFGTGIFVRQGDGYATDASYAPAHAEWRTEMMAILELIDQVRDHLSLIEFASSYEDGKVDVTPLPHRIQLEFTGPNAEADMVRMKFGLAELGDLAFRGVIPRSLDERGFSLRTLSDLAIVDESNPEAGRFLFYVMPRRAPKQAGIERVVRMLSEASGTPQEALSLFIAGDTLTDLRCGLYAGAKANGTFVLASGSRIAPFISPNGARAGEAFAGQKLDWVQRRLVRTNRKGFYRFKPPLRPPRTVIIGDEAFPGSLAPESVLQAFEETLH